MTYAEEVGHYWKTSQANADTWIDKAIKQIEKLDGTVIRHAFGHEGGREAYMIQFEMEGECYKLVWPVLESKADDFKAARKQAATMLYHDVKAKTLTALILGSRAAFFSYLQLPDGRTVAELASPEVANMFPLQLKDS